MLGGGRSYYFRPRPGGAALLKIEHEPRLKRSRLHRIAGLDSATATVRVTEGHVLTPEEQALIDAYFARGNGLGGRGAKAVSDIGHIAHWAQFKASPEELADATEELLLAMQDLRDVLVRKAARRNVAPD